MRRRDTKQGYKKRYVLVSFIFYLLFLKASKVMQKLEHVSFLGFTKKASQEVCEAFIFYFAQDTKLRKRVIIFSFRSLLRLEYQRTTKKGYWLRKKYAKLLSLLRIGYWYLFFEGIRVIIFSFVCEARDNGFAQDTNKRYFF